MAASEEVHRDSNQDDIQVGDILKFERNEFYHYAVYIGGGEVVHQTKNKGVVKQDLKDVIEGCPFFIDNYLDKEKSPKSPDQIVEDALSKVGRKGYSLLTSNCEHFATWCRYGTGICKQISTMCKNVARYSYTSGSKGWLPIRNISATCSGCSSKSDKQGTPI